jgi:hypothetical protein
MFQASVLYSSLTILTNFYANFGIVQRNVFKQILSVKLRNIEQNRLRFNHNKIKSTTSAVWQNPQKRDTPDDG